MKSKQKKTIRRRKLEIGFQKILHPINARESWYLPTELIENLTILLDNEIESNEGTIVCLPTEEEMMEKLSIAVPRECQYAPQQQLAVVWYKDDDTCDWSLGFFVDQIDTTTLRVDHLISNDKVNWQRPAVDDIQLVNPIQLVSCNIDGYWAFSRRKAYFESPKCF